MVTLDPRIDAYIDNAPGFAQPVLRHLRSVIHAACPDVVETIKWKSPSFEYKGMLCGFAAFKEHCAFGFWKHELVVDTHGKTSREAMGSFGRITSLEDLPSRTALTRYIKAAMKLNVDGVKVVRDKTTKDKKPVGMPAELKAALALAKHKKARATFEAFSPSHQREYMEWIGEAKGEETRARRLAQALEWMAEGKSRNWKYMKC
jgi:uncharacterized protein YdeI (YjbR/CyaY-like superfamily)